MNMLMNNLLTSRQIEVLQSMADGDSCKETAIKLYIVTGTVKNHRKDIYNKLGAMSAAHAVAIGIREGIIE